MSSDKKTGAVNSLLQINNLSYRMQSDMSVAVSRHLTTTYAQMSQYKEREVIVFTLNSGASYIETPGSYLQFTLTAPAGLGFGEFGSACNIFDRVRLLSKDGTEIENVSSYNLWAYIQNSYGTSNEWKDTYGEGMGINATFDGGANRKMFIVPMNRVFGLWNVNQSIPSHLASGMRIELTLAPTSVACFDTDATVAPASYTVDNPVIQLMSVQLTDAVSRELMSAAASVGSQILFETVHNSSYSFAGGDRIAQRVDRAVSRALGVVQVTRVELSPSEEYKFDSFKSEEFDVASAQLQLGSQYFPQQPFGSVTDDVAETAVQIHYATINGLRENQAAIPRVSLTQYKAGSAIWYQSMARSGALSGSGVPLNSSRSIMANIRYKTNKGADVSRNSQVFVISHRLVTSFLSNTTVEE